MEKTRGSDSEKTTRAYIVPAVGRLHLNERYEDDKPTIWPTLLNPYSTNTG